MFLGREVSFNDQLQAAVRCQKRCPVIKVQHGNVTTGRWSTTRRTTNFWSTVTFASLCFLSSFQGWPISFGVQSLLLFLAPFEIGYSEGQISSYLEEDFATKWSAFCFFLMAFVQSIDIDMFIFIFFKESFGVYNSKVLGHPEDPRFWMKPLTSIHPLS